MENFRKDLISRLERKGIEIDDKTSLKEFTTFFLGSSYMIGSLKKYNDDDADSLAKSLSDTLFAHKMNQCKIEIKPQYTLKGAECYLLTMSARNDPLFACF